MYKVCARWESGLLKDHERETRVRYSSEFSRRYEREGEESLDSIITTDETWLWHFDPETKAQSCVWIPRDSSPKKARVQGSGGKHMFMFFMDRKDMILKHQVPVGHTMAASYYSKVLMRDLMQALKKKRPDLDPERIIFHQGNAPGHRADSTLLQISLLGFEILQHPPSSPDLAPLDFRVFQSCSTRSAL